MELTIEQALQRGITAHREGKFSEAERCYRAILQSRPDHPDANHNLGVLAVSLGHFEAALPLFKAAVEAHPSVEQFWLSYIDALIKQNELGQAFRTITESEKKIFHSEKIYELKSQVLSLGSKTPPPKPQLDKLRDLYQNGQYYDAENLAISITQQFPGHQLSWKVLGVLFKESKRLPESVTSSKRAIALCPDDAQAYYNYGNTLRQLGDLNISECMYKRSIFIKVDYAQAHRHVALYKKFEPGDEQFLQMQKLYDDKVLSGERLYQLCFALGKACEDLGELSRSLEYYTQGNSLRKTQLKYNIKEDVKTFSQLKANFPRIQRHTIHDDESLHLPIPVFIVGMPRSGTTLVEQIISSHSSVTGAGELPFVEKYGSHLAKHSAQLSKKSLNEFRKYYFEKLKPLSQGAPMVTDKMPHNFRYIGLIACSFPSAKIIHVKRSPAATCWGNFRQLFFSKALGYSHSLTDITKFYSMYRDLMAFWNQYFSERIYHLDYESLTKNQRDETQKLIRYLGLSWEEACLSPQNNRRTILTASTAQVRDEVYKDSSEEWKKYKPFLNGILDKINDS